MPKSNLEKSKKFRQALKKVIATGLSVLALTPMTKSFVPSTLKAFNEVGENKNKKDDENNLNTKQNNQVSETEVKKEDKNYGSSLKNKFKNSSAKKKILAFGAFALVVLGFVAYLAKKLNSGEKKGDDSPLEIDDNESNFPSIEVITLIGDSGSGKTTFLSRMSNGVFFNDIRPTIGADLILMKRTFSSDQEVNFNFWDVSCQEPRLDLTPTYIKCASLVLIFIDLSKDIDQQLNTWFKTFKNASEPKTKAMVILSRPELVIQQNRDIEFIKQHIDQSITDDPALSEKVTLFKDQISSEKITNENMQEFENEIYRIIAS